MDRVGTLLQKLQEQLNQGAAAGQMLLTAQMLQHELMHLQSSEPAVAGITVSMPVNAKPAAPLPDSFAEKPMTGTVEKMSPETEEKTVEVLQVDEAEVEAELEEIKRNAALMQQISGKSKPQLLFNLQEDDIPTLAQQTGRAKEINELAATEITSMNEALKISAPEVSHKLTEAPVKDLKKAIGVNDRFLYINELFRGDEAMYERSIKTINAFSIWPEAEYWIRRELKTKLGWIDTDPAVRQFDQLVKRRFS